MESRGQASRIGPYRLVRPLKPGRLGVRWLAVNDLGPESHVIHELPVGGDKAEQRRFLNAIESLAGLDQPHILPIEQFTLSRGGNGRAYVITPYTGTMDGLVTLKDLLAAKGGSMSPLEAERAVVQLLEAVRHAHERSLRHGPIGLDEILVDRRGSLWIELYGMARLLRRAPGMSSPEPERDEVRSVIGTGYRLLTGVAADEPRMPAARLVKRLDKRWDGWFDEGLDAAAGYESAAEALAALPSSRREEESRRVGPVRVVLNRLLGTGRGGSADR